MQVSFTLHCAPFSINSMFYKTRATKTREAKLWERTVFQQLKSLPAQKAMEMLRAEFNPKQYSFAVHMTFYFPEAIFWTQENTMSGRAFDLSNIEKPLLDLLMLPKYNNTLLSNFTPNIGADDKYVSELHSKKLPGPSHKIDLLIELHELTSRACPLLPSQAE